MKIYLEPKVILLWRPALIAEGVAELLARYGLGPEGWQRAPGDSDGDGIPELYGRMCYSSVGSLQGRVGAASYHDNILRSGHGSVLETATWGFVVCGASRGYLAQQTRHRAGFAYAAESSHFTHYAEEGKGTVEPGICVTGLPVEEATFVAEACRHALKDYATLWKNLRGAFPADAKIKKLVSGAARGLLPTAIECKLGFTVNARALRHLCETRGNAENTLEIRLVVAQLAEIMKREAPAIFQDFTIETADDGYPVVVSKHKKV